MLVFDLIILGILIWAFFAGIRNGIVVQIAGLAGLFGGAYLAFRFGGEVGRWLGVNEGMAPVAGFAILFLATLVVVALIGKLLRGMFKIAGLGVIDKIGGAVLSLLKAGLVLALCLYCFDYLNDRTSWVDEEKLEESRFYGPLVSAADKAFPYLDIVKDAVMPQQEKAEPGLRETAPTDEPDVADAPEQSPPAQDTAPETDSIPVYQI